MNNLKITADEFDSLVKMYVSSDKNDLHTAGESINRLGFKNNIGETIYNHISKLNKTQLENQLKELRQELKIPTTTERYSKLKDEEFLILYRLERTSEFNYAKGGSMGWKHKK